MSQNNNYPVTIEELTTKMKACASTPTLMNTDRCKFGYQASTARAERRRKNFFHRSDERPKHAEYYLFPIGGSQQQPTSGLIPKWTDVAEIMLKATTNHRNIDPRKLSRVQDIQRTISTGTISSMLLMMKVYAVCPLLTSMISMKTVLEANLTKRVFTEEHARFVCVNLLMATRFLHEHGIFHGSISPNKVVFNEKFYPCLTGFGTADIIDERQSRPREKLQLAYTTPEQLFNEHMTESTDTYAVGCLVYAMIYGIPPHEGDSPASTRRNIVDKSYVPPFTPERISNSGRHFILKCIKKNESKRLSLIDEKETLLFDPSSWFVGMWEEKLYKQNVPSPMATIIQQLVSNYNINSTTQERTQE